MGVPLFVLELGMGQLTRRGTLGMWTKIGLPRWQGVGLAATLCIWMVGLYYVTILAWTIYYLGRTIAAIPSGHLPWSDEISECPAMNLYLHKTVVESPYLIDNVTGLLNSTFTGSMWCPSSGVSWYGRCWEKPKDEGCERLLFGQRLWNFRSKPNYFPFTSSMCIFMNIYD